MHAALSEILACPDCRGALSLRAAREERGEIESGELLCEACSHSYPIVRFVPRFVPAENYAGNFGFQWTRFRRTQLDSYSGVAVSAERFFRSTGWEAGELNAERVLDVGCGAGRFAEVALSTGAQVVAVDYSAAVDACFDNLGPHPRLDVVQADVYKLPFKPAQFDYVYCLGVIQHTPDVKSAFLSLPAQLKGGGKLAVDVYPKLRLNALWPKYWLRPLTRRMEQKRLLRMVERLVRVLLPVSNAVAAIPVVGRKLRYAVPVVNHRPAFPQLSREQLHEWSVLDTFDMYGPAYDQPQSVETMRAWAGEAGLRNVEAFRSGHVIVRGTRAG